MKLTGFPLFAESSKANAGILARMICAIFRRASQRVSGVTDLQPREAFFQHDKARAA